MEASSFLIIGLVGFVLLVFSALFGGEDVDVETYVDPDIEVDTDGSTSGGGILQWFSIKALSVAAVGFGFTGWALAVNDTAVAFIWTASILIGLMLWGLAVLLLFPWIRRQEGHDLQSADAFQGITADVVVRVPKDGVGTVQFKHPNGAIVRSEARSVDGRELPIGKQVLIVLAKPEHVVVDTISIWDEPS